MPILEPVSGQVGLRFLGKVISGCRDRTAITSVEAVCENPETKSNGRKGADTWVFGAAPGNLCGSATDWWSNEDSNQGPARFTAARPDRCGHRRPGRFRCSTGASHLMDKSFQSNQPSRSGIINFLGLPSARIARVSLVACQQAIWSSDPCS